MKLQELLTLRKRWRKHHRAQNQKKILEIENAADLKNAHKVDLSPLNETLEEQLAQYGRDWERLIAKAAHDEGYAFLSIELLIPLPEIKTKAKELEETIEAKNGALLFFQSIKVNSEGDGTWSCLAWVTLPKGTT